MENYIENIELINNYLNKCLSESESKYFENRLNTNSDFNALFNEHKTFLEGLKRQQLKTEIVKGKQTYVKTKWMNILGVSMVVLTIVAIAYVLISNKSTEVFQNNNHENNSVVFDTISTEKTIGVLPKIDESIIIKDSILSEKEVVEAETLNPVKSVNQLEKPFKKKPQEFKVNTQKDTIIVCKEGTKLTIKANSFIDSKGNLVIGNINLEVTEYYKLSDMLLANLSTTSNEKQLETGGMLYIKAFSGDELLKLNSNMEISFPTANKKEGMQLFSGEWNNGIINWNLENEPKVESVIVDNEASVLEEDIEVPFAVIEQVPVYPGCENGNNAQRRNCMSEAIQKHVQRNFNVGVAVSLEFKGRQRINVIFKINKDGNVSDIRSRGAHPRIEEEANRVIALLPKMKPGIQRGKAVTVPYSLPIIFTISEDSQIFNTSTSLSTQIERDTVYDYIRGETELIREVMHDNSFKSDSTFIKTWETYINQKQIRFFGAPNNQTVILRKSLFEMDNARFKILENDSISRGGHIIRKLWNESQVPTVTRVMRLEPREIIYVGREKVTIKEFENRLQDSTNVSITTDDINSYMLRTSGLGWINCDRFINGRTKRIKYKLKIKNANNASVNLVFKSVNSVLPSRNRNGDFDFGTVAKDEDVVLVAIKKQSGKLYLDIIETKTVENHNLEFNFKEVSLEEIKNELQKLNRSF